MPNTYVALKTETVATATPSVTFDLTGISGYTDLVLVFSGKHASSYVNTCIRFNGDTSTNYSATRLYGNGTSATSARYNTETFSYVGDLNTDQCNTIINIQNYANTTTFKTFIARDNAPTGGVSAIVGLWRKTPIAAITSITLLTTSGNYAVGSTFSLYGIAAAPAWAAKATGGTITNDVEYTYHTFTSSGTFTPSQALSVDYLVIAGGGSGATLGSFNSGGGGGAGGFRTATGFAVANGTPLTVTIGAGGSGSNGSNSVFASITSTGGGYGGTASTAGATGGSGGGGSTESGFTAAGNGTADQGNAGGNGSVVGDPGAGGGGGAGAAGGTGSSAAGGNGGAGITTSFSGSSITYAGGGGGGRYPNTPGTGGAGGGGNGSANGTAGAGTANRGAGGGGAGGPSGVRGAGGSGIVIIRYSNL